MISSFGQQASVQCSYSYNDLLCAKVSVWNGIFSFSEDISPVKIDCNRGEAGLKHRSVNKLRCNAVIPIMTFYVRRFQFGTVFLAFPRISVLSKSTVTGEKLV